MALNILRAEWKNQKYIWNMILINTFGGVAYYQADACDVLTRICSPHPFLLKSFNHDYLSSSQENLEAATQKKKNSNVSWAASSINVLS